MQLFCALFFRSNREKATKKSRMQPEVICWDECVCFYWWRKKKKKKCGRHGEGEVGFGIRLIFEGEMPPFFGVVVKSVLHHRVVQDFAIGFLLRCEPAGDIVGAIAEVVECTAHIHIL